jgi:phosphate transport system substrate-binding protein
MAMRIPIILLSLLLAVGVARAEEKIVIGGSGGLVDEMEELAKIYMAKNASDKIEVIPDPMSSTGGIEGVKNGRLTIGLVTLAPKAEEKLVYRPIGRVMVGVGVNNAAPLTSLSEAQICDIFSGKIKNWKELGGAEGKIMVVARKKDDANDVEMRHKMPCFKDLQMTSDAVYVVRGSELMDAVNKRREVIALINGGSNLLERPGIKPLVIEGVAPSIEAIRTGKYKFFNERGVITTGAPKGLAKRFLDFVGTAEAQKVMLQRGVIPTT